MRITHVYEGTLDQNEFWADGYQCDGTEYTQYCIDDPEGSRPCNCPFDDDMRLVERRSYGSGINNFGKLEYQQVYRSSVSNQYGFEGKELGEEQSGWGTEYFYDWRQRQAETISYAEDSPEADPAVLSNSLVWRDNQDRPVVQAYYGEDLPGSGVTLPSEILAGFASPDGTDVEDLITSILTASELPHSLSRTIYNDRGMAEIQRTYDVKSGAAPEYTETTTYYDHEGRAVEVHSAGRPTMRSEYDARGLLIVSWTEMDGLELTKTETEYDSFGRPSLTRRYERKEGDETPTLDSTNGIITYQYTWHDYSGRVIARADFGTGNDTYWTDAGSVSDPLLSCSATSGQTPCYDATDDSYWPVTFVEENGEEVFTGCNQSIVGSDALLTCFDYDEAGRQYIRVDAGGIATETVYDGLDRTVLVIENALDPDDSKKRFTGYRYDDGGRMTHVAAVGSNQFVGCSDGYDCIVWEPEPTEGSIQVTEYVYDADVVESDGAGGYTPVNIKPSWIKAVHYPDPTTGQPESSPSVTFSYLLDGSVATRTDARGVTLAYTYDDFNRLASIEVLSVPSSYPNLEDVVIDSSWTLEYSYTADGLLKQATTRERGGASTSDLQFTYEGMQELLTATQSGSGLINNKTTTFTWDIASNGSLRLTGIDYPHSHTLNFNYGSTNSIDDQLDRLTSISDSSGNLAVYEYVAAGRRVRTKIARSKIVQELGAVRFGDRRAGPIWQTS